MPSDRWVYKILQSQQAVELIAGGHFAGSADDIRDGFVHLSTRDQLDGTMARHFAAATALVIGACLSARLGDRLAWEPSRDGALFPHLYRPLTLADVTALIPVPDDRTGWAVPAIGWHPG